MKIVYIGNVLSKWGYTPTSIETLGVRFKEFSSVVLYSDKKHPLVRLFHMLYGVFVNKKSTNWIVIDTYSSSAFFYAFFCAQLCKLLRIPYITILHGGDLPNRLNRNPKLCQFLFGSAYRIIAPSYYLFEHFKNAGYKQLQIIPNYIDINDYSFKLRPTPKPSILWVRSFHKTYNPNLAIDILSLLIQKYPNAKLCMVGPDKDGSMDEFKQYAHEKGLNEVIKITGRLSKVEWIKLSCEYDFFLNTTNYDNTPVSVIEAMALGMLVVSTDAGGLTALINHEVDGMIFQRESAESGFDKIDKILSSTLAEKLSMNARKKASLMDWQLVKKEWIDVFTPNQIQHNIL